MEIKSESGNQKILLVLQEANRSLTVKLLAEKSGIAYKNIHRNITQLLNSDYIRTQTVQEGRKRNKYIHLTSLGKSYKPFKIIETPLKERTLFGITDLDSKPQAFDYDYEKTKFGIRFFAWLGRELDISNYYSERLPMLKLKIGLKLIKESGLVDTKTILNKYWNGEK